MPTSVERLKQLAREIDKLTPTELMAILKTDPPHPALARLERQLLRAYPDIRECPFCGNESRKYSEYEHTSPGCSRLRFYIKCTKCGVRGPNETFEITAIRNWNNRNQ